jgi:multifunctional 2-oxoglutarate metabolism enzyme
VTDLQRDDLALGPNSWLVDEMRASWLENSSSVTESWQAFFATEQRTHGSPAANATVPPTTTVPPNTTVPPSTTATSNGSAPSNGSAMPSGYVEASAQVVAPPATPAAPAPAASAPAAPSAPASPPAPAGVQVDAIRGVGARIAANMELSLTVPTATSVRDVPAKLLEVQRSIVNNHLRRTRGGKVSFTHLIAYAVVQAMKTVPAMGNTYTTDEKGAPQLVRHPHIGLGIAADVPKSDGTRSLVLPCIKAADTLSFREFYDTYEALIAKVRTNKLTVDDFAGVTHSVTNPGTIGTRHSVPRLMPGQAAIIGLGAIDYPAAFAAADPDKLAEIGISKVVTVTSTYDHRIIQGAESGLFLDKLQHLLTGGDGFYDDVFVSMGVPYEPARWHRDHNPSDGNRGVVIKAAAVQEIVNAYRSRGHLIADLDPLEIKRPSLPAELDPATYNLTIWDLDREIYTGMIAGADEHKIGDLLGIMRDAYCRTTGIEYMHIMDPEQKKWLQSHVEGVDTTMTLDIQRRVLNRLNLAEAFEKFLAKRYPGTKRFGLEGGESAMVILDAILETAPKVGVTEAVIGMPHRGRLNTLVNVVGKPVDQVFREFEDVIEGTVYGSGDVKYHLGAEGKYESSIGDAVSVSLTPNPSHLEAVAPVVEGVVRAKLDRMGGGTSVLPLLMHGDAAFIGQGIVAETFNLSQLAGYKTGGSIHLVVNNQVGFTTNPDAARSSVYCTDIAKMVQAPIFHVNGDDPEACYRVGELAMRFRQEFQKDVVIDMWCYRRMGHNEGDEPRYTQPLMYERIDHHPSTRELYAQSLVGRKDITQAEADQAYADFQNLMQQALDATRSLDVHGEMVAADADDIGDPFDPVPTGVDRATLDAIAAATHSWPEGFNPHPKLVKQLETRAATYAAEGVVDWALGEAMAFGSMALEGRTVRVSGEDSRRGTFSHRQSVLIDVNTGDEYYPLANLDPEQGPFKIYDSSLSEYAVLGFDYGYSIENPDAFVVWEAQFGDFVNGAQIIIDQFIAAGETKWGQTCTLAMLLPHGYEGQGPEHSSARVERFLQQCAEGNMRVVNVTTAAQLFHLLRRQVHSPNQKPLVVMSPKSGLRAKQSRSRVDELTTGAFREILDDTTFATADRSSVRRVVLCSGKVAWDAETHREKSGLGSSIAVVKVEQLFPYPEAQIEAVLASYPNATSVAWLQEEPQNMGAWSFVAPMLSALTAGMGRNLTVISRNASGSPATGSHHAHDHELAALMASVVDGL